MVVRLVDQKAGLMVFLMAVQMVAQSAFPSVLGLADLFAVQSFVPMVV